MQITLTGRRALLLGGSCDLALGLAEAMLAEGVRPCLTWRDEKGRARIDTHLNSWREAYDSLPLDLAGGSAGGAINSYLTQGVDYLVDFAQDDVEGLVASTDVSEISTFFDANIAGRSVLIQLAARAMLGRRWGRMVYVSSVAAGRPNPGQGFYAAAKLAGEALYRNIGIEMAAKGITAAILRPGYVNAGRGRRYLAGKGAQATARGPLGRALTIREIVDAILFLLSDTAVGFNAAVLTMDGGASAGK